MHFLELAGGKKPRSRRAGAQRPAARIAWPSRQRRGRRSGAEGAGGVARFGEASFIHTGTAGVQLRNKGSKRRLRRPRLRDGHRPGMNKGCLQEQLRPWKLIFVMTGQELYPEFAAINAKSYLSKLPFSIHPDIVTAIHRSSSKSSCAVVGFLVVGLYF